MCLYLDNIFSRIPQVLSQVDQEFFSKTYGCGDRVYWCWKFTDFPGARFQEFIYTLSWLYSATSFHNQWKGNQHILQLIEAGLKYWCNIQYLDGSFDEAYPFEHSLAATAFTTFYLTEGYDLVKNDLSENTKMFFLEALDKASQWMNHNCESHGILSNHLAAAAAGLYNASQILKNLGYLNRVNFFLDRLYKYQSDEGWYEEYGGADIGYQTHASFFLARILQKTSDQKLLMSLRRANNFLQYFIHPDGSVGGEYTSRNTTFFYPAAFEMLYSHCAAASAIADFQRENIRRGMTVGLEQMDAYNLLPVLNNYIFAYENYCNNQSVQNKRSVLPFTFEHSTEFFKAGFFTKSTQKYYAIVGCKKGGVIRIWDKTSSVLAFQSSGYVTQLGKNWFSNQALNNSCYQINGDKIEIEAPFVAINQKIFSPWLFLSFRFLTLLLGRSKFFGELMKNKLVNVLIKKRKKSPLVLKRQLHLKRDSVHIKDSIVNSNFLFYHGDKFSTFHMGSSRYVHIQEEQIRGESYRRVELNFSSQGILKDGKVDFT